MAKNIFIQTCWALAIGLTLMATSGCELGNNVLKAKPSQFNPPVQQPPPANTLTYDIDKLQMEYKGRLLGGSQERRVFFDQKEKQFRTMNSFFGPEVIRKNRAGVYELKNSYHMSPAELPLFGCAVLGDQFMLAEAYFAAGLFLFDIAQNRKKPVYLGRFYSDDDSILSQTESCALFETPTSSFYYSYDFDHGMAVFEIDNDNLGAGPVFIKEMTEVDGYVTSMLVHDEYLLLAATNSGQPSVDIYSLADPKNPTYVTQIPIMKEAEHIFVYKTRLFILNAAIVIVDIQNMGKPEQVETIPLYAVPGVAMELFVDKEFLAVSHQRNSSGQIEGVSFFDIQKPKVPFIKTVSFAGYPYPSNMAFDGRYLAVANALPPWIFPSYARGLTMIDTQTLEVVAPADWPGGYGYEGYFGYSPHLLDENRMIVGESVKKENGIAIVNFKDDEKPFVEARWSWGDEYQSSNFELYRKKYLFYYEALGNPYGSYEMVVTQINKNPSWSFKEVTRFPIEPGGKYLAMVLLDDKGILVLAEKGGLVAYDINDPSAPKKMGMIGLEVEKGVQAMRALGDTVVFRYYEDIYGTRDDLMIVSFKDPKNPEVLSIVPLTQSTNNHVVSFAFKGKDTLFMAMYEASPPGDAIKIYDISDLKNPKEIGQINDIGTRLEVVGGNVLLMTKPSRVIAPKHIHAKLAAMDVTDPANPGKVVEIDAFNTSYGTSHSLFVLPGVGPNKTRRIINTMPDITGLRFELFEVFEKP